MIKAIKKGKAKKQLKMLDETFTPREALYHGSQLVKTASQWKQMNRNEKIKAVSVRMSEMLVDYLD